MSKTQNNICMVCNKSLNNKTNQYHSSCRKSLFGQDKVPEIPYTYSELNELAKKIIKSQVTVPGVQAKLSLQLDNSLKESERFTIVGLWGNYILKPPIDAYPYMPEIENLTMNLAKIFKIDCVPQGLIFLKSGELSYITRRIDRLPDGQKLHMEDMCQLSGRLTEDKYKGSMEKIGKMINQFSSNPLLDCIRFLEVTIFSFLIGNADMHLKNFSLIYPINGMVNFSPAYDLLSTRLIISEKEDPEEMALTLNGKKRKIKLVDLVKFSENLGLNKKQFDNTLKRFSKLIPKISNLLEKNFLPVEKQEEFKELISKRAERLGLSKPLNLSQCR